MYVIPGLLWLVAVMGWYEPLDKSALAAEITRSLDQLNSISFQAEISLKGHGPSIDNSQQGDIRIDVKMKKGGKAKIEAFRGVIKDWQVLCDGEQITEWVSDDNSWTKYPSGTSPENHPDRIRQLLVTQKRAPGLLSRYGTSWLGPDSPEQTWRQALILNTATKLVGGRTIGGKECLVVKVDESSSHSDGALYLKTREIFKMYFDAQTYLPVRETTDVSAGPMGIKIISYQREANYKNMIRNPPIADSVFEFTPPPGSTFVSPDDPRFAPPPTLEGKHAPGFAIANVDGTPCDLADFKGKRPVLLVFWATWCGPCVQEIPFLRELRAEHTTDALAILAVSSEAKAADLARFAKKKKMTYSVLHDEKKEVSKAYQATAIPRTFLIDKDGMVVKVWKGWSGDEEAKEIRAEIAKLMK